MITKTFQATNARGTFYIGWFGHAMVIGREGYVCYEMARGSDQMLAIESEGDADKMEALFDAVHGAIYLKR